MTGETIPYIDLEKISEQFECNKLRNACEKWGCFRIINHSIPLTLMDEMKMVVVALHDLPMDIKKNNKDVIPGSGYFGPSVFNPLIESVGLYDMGSSQAIQDFCSQLNATPHQRQIMETYGILDADFEDWPCQYRINNYNFTSETIGSFGASAHIDSGFLTILQDDENVGGLEVMDNYGSFVSVAPFHGALLANLGDIARAWSNGRFCNVKHRVLCKEPTTRYSIATFMLGPRKGNVEAPKELVDHDHPLLYRPFTYEEYRTLRVSDNNDRDKFLQACEVLELLRLV
ncbi:2-oxoglutarate-dependent dioxygenase [Medicago truncatula]|uniref:2-oxoglutarate-dependent dioxygenase n=2 Tax=Medicago truncatula TaxID=3880 RepID=G7K2M3_MEDTR|nr:2-oxoglutarate-dependent dioxygenase [Medicago truncatula]